MTDKSAERTLGRSLRAYLWTAAIAAVAGFAAVYVMLAPRDNARGPASAALQTATATQPAAPAEPPAATRAPPAGAQAGKSANLPAGPGANPLSTGQMAGFVFKKAPEPLAEISFLDGDANPKSLADWKGRVVLLNLWATWCAPCRKEMPALDRLQKEMGSDKFEVVALAIDRGGIEKARKFLTEVKSEHLKLYVDPTAKLTNTLKAIGLPTTLLVKDGKEIGRLVGPAEWDSPEAKALIAAAME